MAEKGSRAHAVLGGKKKSSGSKKVHHIHVHRGASGGFTATHQSDDPNAAPETHVLPDMAALQQHMQDNMGDQPPAPSAPQGEPGMGAPPMPSPGM